MNTADARGQSAGLYTVPSDPASALPYGALTPPTTLRDLAVDLAELTPRLNDAAQELSAARHMFREAGSRLHAAELAYSQVVETTQKVMATHRAGPSEQDYPRMPTGPMPGGMP